MSAAEQKPAVPEDKEFVANLEERDDEDTLAEEEAQPQGDPKARGRRPECPTQRLPCLWVSLVPLFPGAGRAFRARGRSQHAHRGGDQAHEAARRGGG